MGHVSLVLDHGLWEQTRDLASQISASVDLQETSQNLASHAFHSRTFSDLLAWHRNQLIYGHLPLEHLGFGCLEGKNSLSNMGVSA